MRDGCFRRQPLSLRPDKTFDLKSSTDLYLKLLFDIDRLKTGGSSKKVQYAAFDAAVTSSHILDWVLHEVDPASHVRLTGIEKGRRPKRGELGPISGFIAKNGKMLPALEYCRQIANSVKHVMITMGPVMSDMPTGSTVKLEWTDDMITSAYAIAYIQEGVGSEKINVVDLSWRWPANGVNFCMRSIYGSSSRLTGMNDGVDNEAAENLNNRRTNLPVSNSACFRRDNYSVI